MKLLPDPLHPALVHFPIVLILLGAITALAAVASRKHHVPLLAAILLSLGAAGCWAALASGESDEEVFKSAVPGAGALLDQHEDWAKRTLATGFAAAVLATTSVALLRFPKPARGLAVVAAIMSLSAAFCVYQTGHRGGTLVYGSRSGAAVVDVSGTGHTSGVHADED